MNFEKLLFYVFAIVTLGSAVLVITRRNPVHAVLFLILTFFNAAGLWLLLEAEFLAITLIVVYVGAVMVLFLFVVMLLDIDLAALRTGFVKQLPLALIVAASMLLEMLLVLGHSVFNSEQFPKPAAMSADYSNTEALGNVLYTVYLYPFEIAAVILLVAIIAAISLTQRRYQSRKYQIPSAQSQVKKSPARVRLVSMVAEQRVEPE